MPSKRSPIWDFTLTKMKHREKSSVLQLLLFSANPRPPSVLFLILFPVTMQCFLPAAMSGAAGSPLLSSAQRSPLSTFKSKANLGSHPQPLPQQTCPSFLLVGDLEPIPKAQPPAPELCTGSLRRESSHSYDVSVSVTYKDERTDRVRQVACRDDQCARARRDRREVPR